MLKQKKVTKSSIKRLEKKELKKKDKEWALNVKKRFNNSCIFCGSHEKINAHHIIPREIKKFRHEIDNGIALCPKHHRFSFEFSAHQNPFAFMLWFSNNHLEQFTKLIIYWCTYLEEQNQGRPKDYLTHEEALNKYGKELLDKMKGTGWLDGVTGLMWNGEMMIPESDYTRAYLAVNGNKISVEEWD